MKTRFSFLAPLLALMRAGMVFADEPGEGGAPLMADTPPADPNTPAAEPAAAAAAAAAPAVAKTPDAPAAKAPEKYEFKPTEGFELNEALAGEFTPVLRDLDLTQEQADKLVAFAPKLIEQGVDAAVSKTLESMGYAGCKDWPTAAKTDKEFGGDKFAENLGVIKAARDQFATPELRKMLETTPLGNNPEVLRLFYRIGKQITADGYVPGGKTAGSDKSLAQKVFPSMNP